MSSCEQSLSDDQCVSYRCLAVYEIWNRNPLFKTILNKMSVGSLVSCLSDTEEQFYVLPSEKVDDLVVYRELLTSTEPLQARVDRNLQVGQWRQPLFSDYKMMLCE